METYQNSPIHRFKGLPRVEAVVKDSTAIMLYKQCGLKYFFRIVLGYTVKEGQPYFSWGSAIHKYREILELEYKANKDSTDFKTKDILFEFCHVLAVKAALDVWKKDPQSKVQIGTKWEFFTEARLKKTFEKIKTFWIKEKSIGNITVLATEQPFTIVIKEEETVGDVTGYITLKNEWVIGGRFDQIIRWFAKVWGRDFKSSSKPDMFFSRSINPNHQFITYTYAETELHGEQVQGQLVEMIFNDKTKGPEVYNHPVTFTIEQIQNWKRDIIEWLKRIDKSRETDHYPANEGHCHFCEFHNVCKMSNENGMANFLKNNYKFDPWDYTTVRD